jgi:hypothetical protein
MNASPFDVCKYQLGDKFVSRLLEPRSRDVKIATRVLLEESATRIAIHYKLVTLSGQFAMDITETALEEFFIKVDY